MKRMTNCCLLAIAMTLIFGLHAFAGASPPKVGDQMPVIKLPVPGDSFQRDYLGIHSGTFFTIPQIKSQFVIIQIFSMYCPHCQRNAPEVNKLFELIENNPGLKGKMKLIGIGAGNSPFEVDFYRKTYKIPFPLFPDEDFVIHKVCGEVRTPYFFGVKIHKDGSDVVSYSKLGGFEHAEDFLKEMVRLSGIK